MKNTNINMRSQFEKSNLVWSTLPLEQAIPWVMDLVRNCSKTDLLSRLDIKLRSCVFISSLMRRR